MAILLLLGACTQTIIESSIQVNERYLSDQTRSQLVQAVVAKAEHLGGVCKLVSEERKYYTCSLGSNNPQLNIGLGYNSKSVYTITVTSTRGHWLPAEEGEVLAGKYLTDMQKDLEVWMHSLLPEEAVMSAKRSYVGYNATQDF